MCGCHFLILSSNALWRKFVKLDQGRLKLVYKGVSEGRRRRNVVHLRRLNAFNQPNWVVQLFSPPLLFFRVVAHAVRCHVFSHFALERMQGGMVRRGWIQEGECEEKPETTVLFLLLKPARGQGLFFFPQGEVFANRPLTVWAAQSKVVFVHLFKILMCIVPVHLASTVNCHSTIGSVQHAASYLEATGFHLHILTKS